MACCLLNQTSIEHDYSLEILFDNVFKNGGLVSKMIKIKQCWILAKKRLYSSLYLFLNTILLMTGIVLIPCMGFAEQVTLTWNEVDGTGLTGYRIYSRPENQAYNYSHITWEGAENICTITDLGDSTAYCFVVRAYNENGESDNSNEVVFSPVLNNANLPPTADAGPDQIVDELEPVSLSGSNSVDLDDGIASFEWVQISGPNVFLSNPDEEETIFTAPETGVDGEALSFRLIVSDYSGLEASDTCIINVSSVNSPPVSKAGPDITCYEGNLVTLDASGSDDPDDGIKSYQWLQVGGTAVSLAGNNTAVATFTAPVTDSQGESLRFLLTVIDNGGLRASDTCFVTVSWINDPPYASAGTDQTVTENESVMLDGSDSYDTDDGIALFQWNQTAGAPVTLSDATSPQPVFTAPETGPEGTLLSFTLTVTDNNDLKAQDSCSVNITDKTEISEADNVQIIMAYSTSRKTSLFIRATTDAPKGSVVLTAWGVCGSEVVNLGNLKLSSWSDYYYKYFWNLTSKPDRIFVVSSGGGYDSQPL